VSDHTDIEREIFRGIQQAIGDAVKNHLAQSYKETPLSRLVEKVMSQRTGELESILNDAVTQAFGEFRDQLKNAAAHKLARTLISKVEGEIEKRANELRADPGFRARLTLAIQDALK